jgi:DNA-binding transcriptional LysR family regulator
MIKLMQLKYFIEVVEAGSVTMASRNLFISQPGLSKQLAQLEKEMNCELFLRKASGIELTEAGKHLYAKGIRLIREAEDLKAEMSLFSDRTNIVIGSLPSIGSYLIPSLVSRLGSRFNIELIIRNTTEELIKLAEENGADLVFVQDGKASRHLAADRLFWEPYDAILPAATMEENHSLGMEKLVKQELILHKPPCDIRTFFEAFCKSRKIGYSIKINLETNESIVHFVSNGLGASVLPRMMAKNLNNPAIKICKIDENGFGRTIDLLYKPSLKKVAKSIKDCTEQISGAGGNTVHFSGSE